MQPKDIQQIGSELAVKWDDDSESYLKLETMRACCPCATCKGETDIMGNVYKGPDVKLTPAAYQLTRIVNVGDYAIQPFWADGHSSGMFSYEYLKRVADLAEPAAE